MIFHWRTSFPELYITTEKSMESVCVNVPRVSMLVTICKWSIVCVVVLRIGSMHFICGVCCIVCGTQCALYDMYNYIQRLQPYVILSCVCFFPLALVQ